MSQAIQVRDGMAVEYHAEEIDGSLVSAAADFLSTGPALTAFDHVVDWWCG